MFFGLGFGELLLVLLVFALPILGISLIVRMVHGGVFSRRTALPDPQIQDVLRELQRSQDRIEELEIRVAHLAEQTSFTQELLAPPRSSGTTPQ